MAIVLKITGGKPESIRIEDKPVIIGRAPSCDVIINSEFGSGQHCIFFLVDGHLNVKDLKSTNGTMLNGELIKNSQIWLDDIISIGRVEVCIELGHMSDNEIILHTQKNDNVKVTMDETVDDTKVPLSDKIEEKMVVDDVSSDTRTNSKLLDESRPKVLNQEDIKKCSSIVNNVDFLRDQQDFKKRVSRKERISGLELTRDVSANKRELRKNRLKKIQETLTVEGVNQLFKYIKKKITK